MVPGTAPAFATMTPMKRGLKAATMGAWGLNLTGFATMTPMKRGLKDEDALRRAMQRSFDSQP